MKENIHTHFPACSLAALHIVCSDGIRTCLTHPGPIRTGSMHTTGENARKDPPPDEFPCIFSHSSERCASSNEARIDWPFNLAPSELTACPVGVEKGGFFPVL